MRPLRHCFPFNIVGACFNDEKDGHLRFNERSWRVFRQDQHGIVNRSFGTRAPSGLQLFPESIARWLPTFSFGKWDDGLDLDMDGRGEEIYRRHLSKLEIVYNTKFDRDSWLSCQ